MVNSIPSFEDEVIAISQKQWLSAINVDVPACSISIDQHKRRYVASHYEAINTHTGYKIRLYLKLSYNVLSLMIH